MSNYTKSTNFATKDNLTPGDPLKVVRGTEIDTEYNNIATAIATKTDNASAAITGGSITGITDLAVADGGTGASTAAAALNNLLPSQTSAANKYLQSDGTNASWDAVSLSTADITGTLGVANGGTGVTTSTGTTNVVLSNSPTLVTPALGTPSSAVLTNATGLPISTGVSGLGTGVATFLGTPSSANLISAVTDETGTGSLVFATSPTLVTPALGTPSALVGTNITGTASGLTAGNVTTNANLTGAVTSVGNATSLGSFSSANLLGALTDETGTGSAVFATSPTLVTPILGTPTSATLTNATGLPISTGVSGLGTGVATFLATPSSANLAAALTDETGSGANVFATSPTLVTPILGTPTSATLTNATGLPLTTGVTGTLPTANGGTNLTSFTSGGVVFASSSSVLATGSALTFDGTNLNVTSTGNSIASNIASRNTTSGTGAASQILVGNDLEADLLVIRALSSTYTTSGVNVASGALIRAGAVGGLTLAATDASGTMKFTAGGATEGMRLTSTGLGIGTTTMGRKLNVAGPTAAGIQFQPTGASGRNYSIFATDSGASVVGALGFFDDTASAYRMLIDSSGNVGIGTSSPETKLHVASSNAGGMGATLMLDNPSSSTLNSGNQIAFANDNGASFAGVCNVRLKSLTTTAITGAAAFTITTYDGSAEAERARITSAGDFLIGSTSTAGTNAPSAITVAGRLRSVAGTTASIANGLTVDIALTMPRAIVSYFIVGDGNSGFQSAGFFRANDNGASSTYVLFSQSENGVAVTSPSSGIIRITNNTGVSAAFNYAFTVLSGT